MARVVNMPSHEVIKSIVGRKRHKHPNRRDVSRNRPHVIDWDKMQTDMVELIGQHREFYQGIVDGTIPLEDNGDDHEYFLD